MALPNVIITVNRSGLGLVSFTKDGIVGICLTGVSVLGKLELDKPYSIFSVADAVALGIGETGDNTPAYKQIKEFYDEAGEGKKLWIIVSDSTVNMPNKVNNANPESPARKLLDKANGEIVALGVVRCSTEAGVPVDGFLPDLWETINNLQVLANNYQEKIMPFCGIIDGIGFTGDPDVAKDLHSMTKHRCTVILSASGDDSVASVGQFLGRLANNPVQRKASRVKSGGLTNLKGYLTDGQPVDDRMERMSNLHDKGYVVYRTFPGRSEYFYSGDPTATLVTDDLCVVARNRIIDKVIKIAYNTYTEELDEDVDITDKGTLEPAVCAYLKTKIEQQVRANTEGEISLFTAIVDSEQNILSGLPLKIKLQIIPKGYLNTISVELGFTNPFNS
jgi:hypothetical protein